MEKEKLFYNLHVTIQNIEKTANSRACYTDKGWSEKLHSKFAKLDEKMLDLVLDVYSRLTSYSFYNLSFIVLHADLLEDMFFKNGEFIEENLGLLYTPYAECLEYSHIITMHCFKKNILDVKKCMVTIVANQCVETIENLIKKSKVTNSQIVSILDTLFELNEISTEFVKSLDAGPLHKMQMTIYSNTYQYDANAERSKYIDILKSYDHNTLDKVVDYITTNDFIEHKTLNAIAVLNIKCLNELIEKYGEKVVFDNILSNKSLAKLFMESPIIAMKLYDLYKDKKIDGKLDSLANDLLYVNYSQRAVIEKLINN